jgi:hypothetical protein
LENSKWFLAEISSIIFWFISKLVGQIFDESLPGVRKERQIAPQASAGYPLSVNSLLAIRKAQRGRDKKASEESQNPLPQLGRDMRLMIASNPAKAGFSSGPLKSQDILNMPVLGPSTDLEMIHILIQRSAAAA